MLADQSQTVRVRGHWSGNRRGMIFQVEKSLLYNLNVSLERRVYPFILLLEQVQLQLLLNESILQVGRESGTLYSVGVRGHSLLIDTKLGMWVHKGN